MYHIEDLKKFVRCPRLYFLANKQASFNHYLRSDESLNDLLIRHLKIDNYYKGVVNDINDCFFKEKDNYEWFLKTRFEDYELRIKIPLMHKTKKGYDIYFVYNGTSIKELDPFYYRVNLEVLDNVGVNVNNVYIAYINGEYVFDEILDVDSLFIIADKKNGVKLLDYFNEKIIDYKYLIDRIKATNLDSYSPIKTRACHLKNKCDFYDQCFKDEKDLLVDSILTLVSSGNKDKMYRSGIKRLKDVDLSLLEGNRVQYAQIMASKNNGLYVSKYALKNYLDGLKQRPITFLDFEWDTYLIPQYNKMKPLKVLPFEYVIYVLDEEGELKHYTFLGKGDCRREFALGLLKYIPKNGPIVAYNAYGAECYRIKELAEYFPEYSNELNKINSRFKDLATPFLEGLIYDTRMKGNYSLKSIVDAISNYSYKDLEINNGMNAVYNWRDIDKDSDDIDKEKIINELIEYCSLDAYGLYIVYKWLCEQIL